MRSHRWLQSNFNGSAQFFNLILATSLDTVPIFASVFSSANGACDQFNAPTSTALSLPFLRNHRRSPSVNTNMTARDSSAQLRIERARLIA